MRLLIPVATWIVAALALSIPVPRQEKAFNRNIARSAAVQAPTDVIEPSGCSTSECHPGIKQHSYLHGPLQINACDACHVLTDAKQHRFEPSRPQRELCLACHEMPRESDGHHVHGPVLQGACLACHDPHGSEQPRAILQSDRAALCLGCHQELTGGQRIVHAPESKGSCALCHAAHDSPFPGLLLKRGRALCLTCHVEVAEQIRGSFLVHPPATDDCRLCHDPHASDNELMLVADPVSLCTGCHQDIDHDLNNATHPHAAMTAGKACVNCHEPHASDFVRMLRGPTSDLCFQCHDKIVQRKKGAPIPNMKAAMDAGAIPHGPAARGDCVLCHQVHGNDQKRLLKRKYTDTYAAFEDADDYALCFSCHDRQLLQEESATAVTGFRNGNRNLHYVHVNRPKSRSCNICHDPHVASSRHILRTSFPFGPSRWPLVIAWEESPTGGRCAGACHAPFAYDRVRAVENPRSRGDEEGWRGRIPGGLKKPIKNSETDPTEKKQL